MLEDFRLEDSEKTHTDNISKLIKAYGESREQEIRELYNQNRTGLEANATIKDHIAFFTYRETEKILTERYGKIVRDSKTPKPNSSKPYNMEKTTEVPKKGKGLLRFIFR
jgi:hypothetical protein